MAKNVFQKKKRISHFQRTMDIEGGIEYTLSGCHDFVSSIMESMDSSFNSIHSDYTKKCSEISTVNTIDQREDNSSPSSSKSISQKPNSSSKWKNFSSSRKFPLMEKSQKIMKQLKHNRKSIPKPRAHLATISKSPMKKNTFCNSTKASQVNKREKQKEMQKLGKNNNLFNESYNNSTHVNNKNSKMSKISTNLSKAEHKMVENIKSKKSHEQSENDCINSSIEINNNVETDTLNDKDNFEDNGDTTDSEYERFVKKNKKGLQKKNTRKKKQKATKSKASTKKLKRKKPTNTLEDSYNCDSSNILESSSNFRKTSPFKKQKIACEGLTDTETTNVLEDSESDMIPDDVCTRDSSAESDNETLNSYQPLVENVYSGQKAAEPFSETLSDAVSLDTDSCHKTNVPETTMYNDCTVSNSDVPGTFSSYVNNSDSVKIEQSNLPSNLMVIDLCDSDDDSSNVMSDLLPNIHAQKTKPVLTNGTENSTGTNGMHPDSDESDIEVIEFIPNQQKEAKCMVSVPADRHDLNITAGNEEKCVNVENDSVDNRQFPVVIKTENLVHGSSTKASHVKSESASDIDDESNVVYMTNICNEFSHTKVVEQLVSNQSSLINSKCSKALDVSSKDSSLGETDLKKAIKREKEAEDDIVVIRTVETSVLHSTKIVHSLSNRSTVQDENIKLEPSNSENELKLCNSVHAESKSSETCNSNQELQDFIPLSSKDLLDLYKREFQIYMEMKEAEANVEASLKNLQTHQAEKVHFIRSLVKKYIGSGPNPKLPNYKDSTSQVLMNDKPSMFLPLEMPKDSENFVQNVQTNFISKSSPANASSLSPQTASTSTVGKDIKPAINKLYEEQNVLELQHTVKRPKLEAVQEDVSSAIYSSKVQSVQKQTLKLSAEKCNVCGKEAIAACQGCARVFFCSHECGKKFWKDGHGKVCGVK